MAPRYSPPSIEAIPEIPEDESRDDARNKGTDYETVISTRRREHRYDPTMPPTRNSSEKNREKSRRSHRPSSSVSSRSSTTSKSKVPSIKPVTPMPVQNDALIERRLRHRRTRSHPSGDSSSSSSDDEVVESHHDVLAAARRRLTSPSQVSTLTSLTTATNNSGSSSGSNSTITQTTVSQELTLKPLEPTLEAPISPAVPDPPDVFSFLEQDSPDDEEDDEGHTEEAHEHPQWLSESTYQESSLPRHSSPALPESMSSSGSSSFHSDYTCSDPVADNDTDRSSSPERSVKGEEDTTRTDPAQPTDPAASKLASQMLAAQHRQSLHGAFQSFGSPQLPRANAVHPPAQSTALSPRMPQHMRLPRGDKPPITGYEALAVKLSNHNAKSPPIKPIYRKFERLNHRLLLHLQDELAELEEQLHRLDSADTQARSMHGSKPGEIRIFPASRRAQTHAGGELEWHKVDLINRIAYKTSQYNQALTSFNNMLQSLDTPGPSDVKDYRGFLKSDEIILESETRFLEANGDLVTFGRKKQASIEARRKTSSVCSVPTQGLPAFRTIAIAVAIAVLLPMLTFLVIPGFFGRMTVVLLVASGVMFGLIQSGIVGGSDWIGKEWEWGSCAAIYAGVMVIVAGVVC